jgi:hypothetical protein
VRRHFIPGDCGGIIAFMLQALDSSGQAQNFTIRDNFVEQHHEEMPTETAVASGFWTGRIASVRCKLLSLEYQKPVLEKKCSAVHEAQRTLCLAESIDIFAGSCRLAQRRRRLYHQNRCTDLRYYKTSARDTRNKTTYAWPVPTSPR